MKRIIFLMFIFLNMFIYSYEFDNALIGNPLPISEAMKLNVLKDLPVKIYEYYPYENSMEIGSTYLLDYEIVNNRLLSHIIKSENGSLNDLDIKYDYHYDNNHLEIVKNYSRIRIFKYFFDNNQLLIREKYTNEGELLFGYECSYNNQNNLSRISKYYESIEDSSIFKTILYSNNKIDRVVQGEIEYFFSYPNENQVIVKYNNDTHQYTWNYDDQGNLIHEHSYNPSGQYLYEEYFFTYDEKNRLETYTFYQYSDPDDKKLPVFVQEYIYDDSLPLGSELFNPRELSSNDLSQSDNVNDVKTSDSTIVENPSLRSRILPVGIYTAVGLTVVGTAFWIVRHLRKA